MYLYKKLKSSHLCFQIVLTLLVAAASAQWGQWGYGYNYGAYPYAWNHAPIMVAGEAPKVELKTVELPKVEIKTVELPKMEYKALPYAYGTPLTYAAAPVAYAAPAPIAYAAPAPIAYQTGAKVEAKYEPVEQHGYEIRY